MNKQSSIKPGDVELAPGEVSFTSSPEISPPLLVEPEHQEVDPDGGVAPSATTAFADGGEPEIADRSGTVSKRARKPADVARDTKSRKSKAPKPAKAPKVAKIKHVAVEPEEFSLPVNVAVDFFRGVTKERDAEQHARAFIEKNFDAPNASYLYVQKWRDGIAVEMQEGGGRAYLPEVLAMLDEDPEALCILSMPNRVLQVRLDAETSSLEAMALTAGQSPTEGSFSALPTAKMIPFDRRGSKVLFIGGTMLIASLIALLFSLGALFLDTKAWAIPHLKTTPVADLPSAQQARIASAVASAECVAKMEYAAGRWNVVPGWNDGSGVCTAQRPVGPVDGAIEAGAPTPGDIPMPPVAASPGAPGAPVSGPTPPPPGL